MRRLYKRTLYLGYYLKQMDWEKFRESLSFVCENNGRSKFALMVDSVFCVYKYNIGLIDYFYFRFDELNSEQRKEWVGTGSKYEYDLVMNPVSKRVILQNKLVFFDAFAPYIKHGMCRIEDLEDNNEKSKFVIGNSSGKIVLKDALGQCGWDVEVVLKSKMNRQELIDYMNLKGFNMVEEFIVQHPDLRKLSDTGLNTIRIITQINSEGEVEYIGPTLRITVNCSVDNMAMGNLAAPIDVKTGRVFSAGVYQEITKKSENKHPITGSSIIGFDVPYWPQVLSLTKEAALHNSSNKSIGWDVAITEKGPSLLEGNHNWCKLLWQLPLQKGMKSDLDKYIFKQQ